MANIITNEKVNEDIIQMSNGLTSVFIETFCLAGADLAKENFGKDLMIWFAQRDWVILGMGFEGFDVSEIIWDKSIFEEQRDFLLQVVDEVFQKTNWNFLSYSPNSELLFDRLKDFKKMISSFRSEMIAPNDCLVGIFPFDEGISKYERCEKHRIYLHSRGCVICHNESD